MFCEKFHQLSSALALLVDQHWAPEWAFTALRDQVGQDQARDECLRLSNKSA
jgi:hypothetical protein